jgi:sodium pump decarboxylase gamma subunit
MERFFESLVVTLIGVGTTFIIMALLVLLIYGFKYIVEFIENYKQNKSECVSEVPMAENPQPAQENGVSSEIVAAICAAVDYCLSAESESAGVPKSGFIVRKIRRI